MTHYPVDYVLRYGTNTIATIRCKNCTGRPHTIQLLKEIQSSTLMRKMIVALYQNFLQLMIPV